MNPQFFALVSLFIAWVVSAIFGRASSSWMIGCCVASSSAANQMIDGWLSTSLKCSAHRLRISLRSVIPIVLSAFTSGAAQHDWFPYTALRPS